MTVCSYAGGALVPYQHKPGSFVYVKNARFNAAVAPRTDLPEFWVALVEELLSGGRVKLQWFMETSVGSGTYSPTNNVFVETAMLLRKVAKAVPKPG